MLRPAAFVRATVLPDGSQIQEILRRHPWLARVARFGVTGGAAALTQLLLLEVLSLRGLPAVAANAVAFLVAAQVNFWLCQTFTWHDRALGVGPTSLAGRWLRFHAAIAGTAVLNMAVFAVAVGLLPHLAAAALGIGVAAMVNFIVGDRLVFRGGGRPATVNLAGIADAAVDLRCGPLPPGAGAAVPDLDLKGASGAGRSSRRWAWLGLATVVGLAAVLYGWGLSRNGFANEYYAAAVLSMSQSWHAFFYGSLDLVGFITVDKPPFAFWIQALSVRLFGMSSWSILLPQAVAALGTLLVVYAMARRQFGAPAATLAGLVFALTPITVAVARVNLPDTILVALMTLGAWATFTAVRSGKVAPLLLGMVCVGLGFNTKMLQAFVVVPSLLGTYLVAAPGGLLRRLTHLTVAGLVLVAVSASWLTVVDSVPADARPYIGGSSDNSVLDLALGYNGLGRVFGQGLARGAGPVEVLERVAGALLPASDSDGAGATDSALAGPGAGAQRPGGAGGPGGFGGGPGFGGQTGWLRLFNNQVGGQIGWLLPLALVSVLAGLIARGRLPRTDASRAWYLLWGGWLVTHVVVFSFAEGIFHPYYTSALAPAIAALCGPGVVALWHGFQRSWWLAWALPAALAGTAAVAVLLVMRSAWLPWLAPAIVAAVGIGVLALVLGRLISRPIGRRIALAGLTVGLAGVLAGPAAWSSTPLERGGMAVNPQAGPMDSFGFGRGGFGGSGGGPFGPGRGAFQVPAAEAGLDGTATVPPPFGPAPLPPMVPGQPGVGFGVAGPGAAPVGQVPGPGAFGQGDGRGAGQFGRAGRSGDSGGGPADVPSIPSSGPGNGPGGGLPPGGPFGGMGPGSRVNAALIEYLKAHRGSADYLVAVNSSMAASPIILQTGLPVMAMGGFSGGDPAPTAEQLAHLVDAGKLRFVMGGGRMGGGRMGGGPGRGQGDGVASERSAWIQEHCQAVDPAAYGDVSAPANQDGQSGRGFGRGGEQQLYDCAPGPASSLDQAPG